MTLKTRSSTSDRNGDHTWLNIPPPRGNFYVDDAIWFIALRNVVRGVSTVITGPTGCGKTSLVGLLSAALDRNLTTVNMGSTSDARSVLLGNSHFKDGRTIFREARFATALRDPKALVLLEELSRASEDALNILLPALDFQRSLSLDETDPPSVLERNDSSVIFATSNSGEEYTGTHEVDRALRDRFPFILEMDYPPREAEENVLVVRTGIDRRNAQYIVGFAHDCREAWRSGDLATCVSTRALIECASAVVDGFSLLNGLKFTVLNIFDDGDDVSSDRTKARALLQKY